MKLVLKSVATQFIPQPFFIYCPIHKFPTLAIVHDRQTRYRFHLVESMLVKALFIAVV